MGSFVYHSSFLSAWIGLCDFRNYKWKAPGSNNSVKAFQMTPRVTLLTALSTEGDVWIALAQSNSNQSLMSLFWRALSNTLDKERPNWRKNTLWTMDGAAYHSGEEALNVLKELKINILM